MNNSRLYIAIAVLAGLVVAVVSTQRSHQSKSEVEKPSASLPAVDKAAVTEFDLEKPGQPAIVVQKQGDKWAITAPLAAEANRDTINAALDKLAELKVVSVASTRKENQARVGVDAEHAIHVRAKAGDKALIDLYVGAAKGSTTVVRQEGKDEALSVKGSIRYVFDKELKDLRNRDITNLAVEQVSALSFTSPKGTFKFVRGANDAWEQAKSEKPIAKFDPEQVQALASTVAHLRAADFAAPNEDEAATGVAHPGAKVQVGKRDNSAIDVVLGKERADSGDSFLRTSEGPVVYRVAKFTADRLQPDAKFFEKTEKPPAQAQMPQGMPPGMMGGGGPGGQGISPEMMEQIKRQLAAQGGHP